MANPTVSLSKRGSPQLTVTQNFFLGFPNCKDCKFLLVTTQTSTYEHLTSFPQGHSTWNWYISMETRTVSNIETHPCPESVLEDTAHCMSFGGNEGFHRVTIWGMDPRIVVTIFNNEEGLAAPAGAELITLSEAVPGCPTEYRPWVSPCLMQADHSWNSENLL